VSIASANLFRSLIRILGQTGCVLNREQKSNLTYAFSKIEPQSIDELSVTIVLGLQINSAHEIVDAYAYRKKSASQLFFPYSNVRGMNEVLSKTFGIILYKEQASLLTSELMQNASIDSSCADFVNREKFIGSLKAEYKNKLSEKEKNAIYVGLLTYSGISMNSYAWCRCLAESIMRGAENENLKKYSEEH